MRLTLEVLVLRVRHVCPSERFGPCPTQSAIPTGFAVGVGLELHKIWNFASPGPHHGARRSANSCHACYKAGPLLLLQPCQFAPKRQCLSQNVNGCVSECVAILLYYFIFYQLVILSYCFTLTHTYIYTLCICIHKIHTCVYTQTRAYTHTYVRAALPSLSLASAEVYMCLYVCLSVCSSRVVRLSVSTSVNVCVCCGLSVNVCICWCVCLRRRRRRRRRRLRHHHHHRRRRRASSMRSSTRATRPCWPKLP